MAHFKVVKPFQLEGRDYKLDEIIDEQDFPAGSRDWLKKNGHSVPATEEEIPQHESQA